MTSLIKELQASIAELDKAVSRLDGMTENLKEGQYVYGKRSTSAPGNGQDGVT